MRAEVQPADGTPLGCVDSRRVQCVSGGAERLVSLEHVLGEGALTYPNEKWLV